MELVRIFQASLAGDVHSYIVAPSAVHGPGTGPVGRTSALIKFFGGEYAKRGEAFVVGEGTNVLGFVSEKKILYFINFSNILNIRCI